MEKNVTQAKSRINRRNYSRISGSLELPNLVEIQTNSYEWFKNEGIKEVFNDVYPISNFNETLTLEFVDCRFDEPKYSVDEAKDRDANYSAPIRATLRLVNNGTGEIKENEVFMGDFPLMTDAGTFIINGAERVIVSQLVRSPGAYFADAMDKSGKTVFTGSMIPSRGTWLEFENDAKDILNVRIDRTRKIPGTILLRALGLSSDEDIIEGQGTIALEILEELPDTDVILVPIGGGGLIAGIACAAKQINPNVKIYGVEPEGAASALAAIHEDQVVTLAEANTIADGTAVKTIGSKTFEYIKKYVDGIITVNDYELMDAFLLLVEKHKLVAEGSGILSLAGLKKLYEKNKKVVSLVSGGNIDVLTISSMINKGLISRGRIFTFSVQLPDKPGQLELVSKVLNQCNANVIAVDHNQFKNFARFSEVELRAK